MDTKVTVLSDDADVDAWADLSSDKDEAQQIQVVTRTKPDYHIL